MQTNPFLRCLLWITSALLLLSGCHDKPLNNPYPRKDKFANYYYASFSERPKTLDPARSYSANENIFIAQIYEPPLQYHYLKRPYTLMPLAATEVPQPVYLNKEGKRLPTNVKDSAIAYTLYTIAIRPHMFYQPHPAFARDGKGHYFYHHLTLNDLENIYTLNDFPFTGTREVTAADYVYEIKRLANPQLQSPILGLMSNFIVGLRETAEQMQKDFLKQQPDNDAEDVYFNLQNYQIRGVKILDRYHFQLMIYGKYPQFLYWLAMPFFAPVPWEVDYFYAQTGMRDRNLILDWYPLGSGPYMLTENNPNKQMILARNPNFHGENYPTDGDHHDILQGYLTNAGKPLPFIDRFIFTLEKETIPRWNKFLQGYYDASSISSDSFDQAIRVNETGNVELTPELSDKGIRLEKSVENSIYYMGFNMLDPVIGGYSESARKLRQAISIAVDYNDYIAVFLNGRGVLAMSPIPPGIFGYEAGKNGIDPYIFRFENNQVQRRSLQDAEKLLAEAGYPQGRDKKTGTPLIINYDVVATGAPDDKAVLDWMRKQFAKLGIHLHIRATTYNRFQEKLRLGDAQLFSFGWSADYPDPENFLFLLYGKNGKVKYGGENAVNYANADFDKLFDEMKSMPDGPARLTIIRQMRAIIQRDAPWIWGFHPLIFTLSQSWLNKTKPSTLINNTLKYYQVDAVLRAKLRDSWNKSIKWPIIVIGIIFLILLLPIVWHYWRRENLPAVRKY